MASESFHLTLSARQDGTLEAAYIRVAGGEVDHTEELLESVLLIDFDANEQVVGVEILAPISAETMRKLAERLAPERQLSFNNFVDQYAPRSLVIA